MLVPIGNIADKILRGLESGTIKTHYRFECRSCFNSGFREINDFDHPSYRGVVKCNDCEYWNFRKQAARAA